LIHNNIGAFLFVAIETILKHFNIICQYL
jgi:hypothetical protein